MDPPSPQTVAPVEEPKSRVRVNWQLKTLLPVIAVLLNGILLFILASVSIERGERRVLLLVAAGGGIAIVAVLLVTLEFVIRRPVSELQEKIQQVRDGDLSAEVSFARRRDDIGDLGRNFNAMVARLSESLAEIERLHNTQMSRAEHLATMGELAAGLAHEIRNPLAGLAGVMDIVRRDLPSSSPAREVLKDARDEVTRINRTLNDLLETARPKTPNVQLADLNATVEHAVIFARQNALSKPIEIELEKTSRRMLVEHDTGRIHQVLLNLMLNAIQSIENGPGAVKIVVAEKSGMATVSIQDTGRGISPENLPNIFRPFFTTKGHGTGLGLPLAKRTVEDHGGRILVESEMDRGSTFTVMLPLRQGNPQA
ncbi:MAG TPA: ATP-binding protein [Terriglobales bacterium]|nr:ATP-binding protein [Terriglobales bacterium]